jgi:hypothetical protein
MVGERVAQNVRHSHPITCVLVGLGLVVAAVTSAGGMQSGAWSLRIEPTASPAAAASGQPQLSVSSRGVLLSWIEREGPKATLKFSEYGPTGWIAARPVASGDNWFVNWADVPSVLRLPNGTIVGHWLEKSGPGTYAYDVRLAYSTDNGRSFLRSFLPHHDATKTEHGFASLFSLGRDFGLIWLDGREMHGDGHSTATPATGGAMTLRYAAFAPSWKQTADLLIDDRVCECCPTTAAVTADGPIVAYRNRSDEEIRDIYVSRLESGKWTAGKPVANDNWHITGCPVNGPMLAARGRDVVLAWFTGTENQTRSFVAFSRDAGRSFGAPIRGDDEGTLGRVDAELLDDGSALISWIEYAKRVTQFRIRRIDPSGARSSSVTIATVSSDRTSGYPRIARSGNQLVMAWVENQPGGRSGDVSRLQVKTAVAKLPTK